MSRLCLAATCAAVLVLRPCLFAESAPAPPAPAEVMACFHDGSVIRGTLPANVEIVTRYGKLTIPVGDVQRVEVGFRLHPEDRRKVEEAIHDLGSKQFKQREAATKALVALGFRAYPALLVASQSKDAEVVKRVLAIVQQLQQTVPADQLQLKPDDVVVTSSCVLTGRLVGDTLKAQSKALGTIQFKLADLRALHSPATFPGPGTPVGVTANAAPGPQGWPPPAPGGPPAVPTLAAPQ